jgi:hypothetical protein
VASICLRVLLAVLAVYGLRRQYGCPDCFKVMVTDNDVGIRGGFNSFTKAEADYHYAGCPPNVGPRKQREDD